MVRSRTTRCSAFCPKPLPRIHPTGTPTDARALQAARGGTATALPSVPLRYMHTPNEVICLKDLEATARLMAAYCRRITPYTDFRPR